MCPLTILFQNIGFLSIKKKTSFGGLHSFPFLLTEASLGADTFNDVAVSNIEMSGVKIIDDNNSTLFNFEGGLGGA